MNKKLIFWGLAGFLVVVGAGCLNGSSKADEQVIAGDGSLVQGANVCVSTDGETVGEVKLSAALVTEGKEDFTTWFSDKALATGEAGQELCGTTPFALEVGDKLLLNGVWSSAERWLVENRTPDASGSDNFKEIWINDQYYAVGKECAYQSNGAAGFDLLCTIR